MPKIRPSLKQRFTMLITPDDVKKIRALADLAGEGMSTVVRSIVRREYKTKIEMKR